MDLNNKSYSTDLVEVMIIEPGTSLRNAICDAIILANQKNKDVKFVFNGDIIKVTKDTKIDECYKKYKEQIGG